MPSPLLAIDIGSTRLKAALVDTRPDTRGSFLDMVTSDSPLQGDTVQADAVMAAVLEAGQRVCQGQRPGALALTGATRTHVFASADGQALAPVMKLDDARGAEFEAALQDAYGQPGERNLGAFHPLARLLDLQRNRPQVYERTRWLLEIKDWLHLALTGVAATDDLSYARLAPAWGTVGDVLRKLGLRQNLCADPVPAGQMLGAIAANTDSPWAPWHGIPVVGCGFDTWCASYGMGCAQEGAVYNVTGTTEVFGSFRSQPVALDGVACLPWGEGLHHLGGPCLTGLGTLAWFGRTFLGNADPQAVLDCASQARTDTPLCVPFVAGERMPFWDAGLSARFLEVRSHHGLPEMAQALLDGLLVFQRQLLGLLAGPSAQIYLGGASALPGWAELKAGAFGRTLLRSSHQEPGLLGAAMCGLKALGHYDSMQLAQAALAPPPDLVPPNPLVTTRMQRLEPRLLPHFPPFPAALP